MTAYVVCVWLHVVAASVWVGSMVFFAAVVVPLLRREELRANAPALIRLLGPRFRVLGWVGLASLIVTGVANLFLRGLEWAHLTSAAFWSQGFGRTLAWKLAFVALVLVMTVLHEVVVKERALDRAVDPVRAERARRSASLLGRVVMLASLVILLLAVAMVRGCG